MLEPAHIAFEPGQALSIRIAATNEQRSYSIASRPGRTDGFALLVRKIGGIGSQFVAALHVGATLEFEGPHGDFRIADHPGDAVFGATGVGASALFPMMESLLARPEPHQVRFFWGLVDPEDQFWADRLAQLAREPRFASRIVLAGTGEGFVTKPIVDTATTLTNPIYYLCGNSMMVREAIDGLLASGIDRTNIRTDWY